MTRPAAWPVAIDAAGDASATRFPGDADPRRAPDGPPCHDARALTAGGATALIDLDGKIYTLRITRAGKLILTR